MNSLEGFFRKNNCNTIKVAVFAPILGAYRLYKRVGFANREVDTGFLKVCCSLLFSTNIW